MFRYGFLENAHQLSARLRRAIQHSADRSHGLISGCGISCFYLTEKKVAEESQKLG